MTDKSSDKSAPLIKELLLYLGIAIISLCAIYIWKFNHRPTTPITKGNFAQYGVTEGNPIVIYTAETCKACQALKTTLKELRVQYVNVDLDDSPQRHEQLHQQNIRNVPVIFVRDTMVVGFNKDLVVKLISGEL